MMRKIRERFPWLRLPSLQTMAFISICMNALGLIGIALITADTNQTVTTTSREERAVIDHRVRNEQYHDCLHDFLIGLEAGVNGLITREATVLDVADTCPMPLTEAEIRNIRAGGHADE